MKLKTKDRLKPLDYLITAWIVYFLGITLSYAQPEPFNGFVSVSIDPKMALQGAHPDNPEFSDSSLHLEIKGGLEWKSVRTWFGYDFHDEIRYKKYAVGFDWKLLNQYSQRKGRNTFNALAGFELGSIHRKRDVDYTSHALYRSNESNWSIGINLGLEYRVLKWLSLIANYNVFTAEKYDSWGNEMKKIRQDGMIGLNFKILK